MFERIVATPSTGERQPSRRRWFARRLWILIPAVCLAAGAGGYAAFRAVTQPVGVACYEQSSLRANRFILQPEDQTPVAVCRALWRPGEEFNPTGTTPAPPLTTCVLTSGALGVFPTKTGVETCSALGLARPSSNPTIQRENQAVAKLQDALATRFLSKCVGREAALSFAQAELQRLGLGGWQVNVPTAFTKKEPCASAAFDVPHKTVLLVPVSKGS